MRYKIKAPTERAYRDVLNILDGRVKVFVTSPKRRMLSTGELPHQIRGEVEARGGRITKDRQYSLEHARSH